MIKTLKNKLTSIEIIFSSGNLKLGNHKNTNVEYNILSKEDESRNLVLNNKYFNTQKLNFLDVGGRDGSLTYLLGDKGNFKL